jgi:hypothetical protein
MALLDLQLEPACDFGSRARIIADVQEGLIDRDLFHERRGLSQDGHHPLRVVFIHAMTRGNEHQFWAQANGLCRGHRRAHAPRPGCIRG